MSGKSEEKKPGIEERFLKMREKVHSYIKRLEMGHTIKKLWKKDPVAVLFAAEIGFTPEADVRDYIYWEISSG